MAKDKGRKFVEDNFQALETAEVVYISVDDIRPNSWNPNRQSESEFELLLESMRRNGFTQPALLTSDGVIIDGEHRWRAARELGYVEIPVVVHPMTEKQAKLSTLRHNRARGQDDLELLGAQLRDMEAIGALNNAAKLLGVNDEEIRKLVEQAEIAEELGDPDGGFSAAWEPQSSTGEGKDGEISKNRMVGSSKEAHEISQDYNEQIVKAKPDERKVLKKEMDKQLYRLNMIFSGDEAALLRTVLGDSPSQKFLEFCEKW